MPRRTHISAPDDALEPDRNGVVVTRCSRRAVDSAFLCRAQTMKRCLHSPQSRQSRRSVRGRSRRERYAAARGVVVTRCCAARRLALTSLVASRRKSVVCSLLGPDRAGRSATRPLATRRGASAFRSLATGAGGSAGTTPGRCGGRRCGRACSSGTAPSVRARRTSRAAVRRPARPIPLPPRSSPPDPVRGSGRDAAGPPAGRGRCSPRPDRPWYIAHSALAGQEPVPDGCGTAATSPPAQTPSSTPEASCTLRYGSTTSRPVSSRTSDSVPGRATGTWPSVVTTVPTGSAGRPAIWAAVAVTAVRRLPHHTSTPACATWAARVVGDAIEPRSQPRQQGRPRVRQDDARPDPDDPTSSADQQVESLLDRHRGLDAGESAAGDQHGEQSRPLDRVRGDGGARHDLVEMGDQRLQGPVALGGVGVGVQSRHPLGGVAAAHSEHEVVVREAGHGIGLRRRRPHGAPGRPPRPCRR